MTPRNALRSTVAILTACFIGLLGSAASAQQAPTCPAYPPGATSGTLTVSANTVAVSGSLTVMGTGFAPATTITIQLTGVSPVVAAINLASPVADVSGNFSVNVTLPPTVVVGSYLITAIGTDKNQGCRALISATITVVAVLPSATPLALSQDAATPGQTITMSGSGAMPNSLVTFSFHSTNPITLGTTRADAQGNFTARLAIPAGATPGAHTLVASYTDSHGNPATLTANVTVVPGLVVTGASIATPALVALAALLLGTLGLVAGRRRQRGRSHA